MKKVFLLLLLATSIFHVEAQETAQESEKKSGQDVFEKKEVITVDGVNANTLYLRALEGLSDWVGALDNSKLGIDVQDKDNGLVVYKGTFFLGYGKQNMMYGWNIYANLTVKIRCKDGRALISLTVPSAYYEWTADGTNTVVPIYELWPEVTYTGRYMLKSASRKVMPSFGEKMDGIMNTLSQSLQKGSDDEDF